MHLEYINTVKAWIHPFRPILTGLICHYKTNGLPGNVRGRKALFTQPGDVLGGRIPEEAAVFPAELRSALIPHVPTRSTCVHHRRQHETPRLLEAQHLLVLQGAHRGDGLEVLVKRGNTHVRQLGQLFDFHGLGEIGAQPGYCFRDSLHTGILKADLGHPDTDRDCGADGSESHRLRVGRAVQRPRAAPSTRPTSLQH